MYEICMYFLLLILDVCSNLCYVLQLTIVDINPC